MRLFLAAALCSVSFTAALASEPAIVSKIGGKAVTLQSGDKTATPGVQTLLAPGDKLSAGKSSFIEIKYLADSCVVRVNAGSSAIISDVSPCAASAQKSASVSEKVNIVPASAPVVEISDKSGPVTRVNRGKGLKDAKVGDSLKPGDEVFAGPNSSVVLYFTEAQCTYKVKGSSVYKVTEKVPCKAAAGAGAGTAAGLGAGVGAGVGATGVALGVGAVAIAGAVAVIATSDSNNDNKKPVTPN
jgi:hypothetical protein